MWYHGYAKENNDFFHTFTDACEGKDKWLTPKVPLSPHGPKWILDGFL